MSIDLEAIKALCAAATEGPWRYVYSKEYREHNVIVRVDDYYEDKEDTAYLFSEGCPTGKADAEFISSAREDVPALVAEVERLRAAYDQLNDFEQTQCAKLLARVGVLERQLAAAVKDLSECPDRCVFCKFHIDSEECANAECETGEKWEWRGPLESGGT